MEYAPELGPLLFEEEERGLAAVMRPSVVAPAARAPAAGRKASGKRGEGGLPARSFQTLPCGHAHHRQEPHQPPRTRGESEDLSFCPVTRPNPLQRKAPDLPGVSLALLEESSHKDLAQKPSKEGESAILRWGTLG